MRCEALVLNTGYFILQHMMNPLVLKEFFAQITAQRKVTFDCYTIARFLTYARILDPKSKYATWDRLDTYYEKPGFDYHHILRFMDVLEDNHDTYLRWLYDRSSTLVPRENAVMYYDCTNFYFECEKEDEQVVDEVTDSLHTTFLRRQKSQEPSVYGDFWLSSIHKVSKTRLYTQIDRFVKQRFSDA